MDINTVYPSVQSAGGVLQRIPGRSPGQIGRPGPSLPGLSRMRPQLPSVNAVMPDPGDTPQLVGGGSVFFNRGILTGGGM